MKNYAEFAKEINASFLKLQKEMPEVMQGFGVMYEAANKEGALSLKVKELIAVAIAVAARCDDCITAHTRKLIESKVTRQELLEMLGVAIYMGGGPSLMYAGHVLKAFEDLGGK